MNMADDGQRNRLGRGLAALLGDAANEASVPGGEARRLVPIELVRPNPNNPRRSFAEEDLAELAESVREKGIIQPILVRPFPGSPDLYEIIAGERRWRAAQRASLHLVPIIVVTATDQEALELAIIENVQRADLNPIEEARGYDRLIQVFGYTQVDLARVVSKSRPHVANTLRLLNLPEDLRDQLESGAFTAGHARAILSAADPKKLAERVIAQGLSVRDTERLAGIDGSGTPPATQKAPKDADTRALERALEDVLGLKVSIDHKRSGGSLVIRYKTLEQLEAVCLRLQR
jgi:ParB family transcriptional regulator, chromosome partitioning protein